MAEFIDDSIDFSLYADMTECKQKVFSAGEYAEEVVAHFWEQKEDDGIVMPWRKTHGRIAIRPGEVSLWAGINGHGKSLVLGQYSISMLPQKQRICVASLEMKPRTTLSRMSRQAYGGSKPSPEFIREYAQTTDKWLYFYDHQGTTKTETALGLIRYAAQELGCHQFILDSMTKCGIDDDDFSRQKRFVDSLCAVAQDTGIHVHLVAHSRKGQDESKSPGKMDVKGSGAITDLVDNVFCWWRNKPKEELARTNSDKYDPSEPDGVLSCDKQRNGEWEGRIGLYFDPASTQYVEQMDGHPLSLLEHPKVGGLVQREDDF